MRHERLYRNDILEATDHIAEFIAGADFKAFQKSEMLRSAVVTPRYHGHRSWPSVIFLSTRTLGSTGTWCGGRRGIVAPF